MPVYEYFCTDCHTKFDARRTMSQADEPIVCKNCTGEHTSRVLSVFFAVSGGKSLEGSNGGGGCACGGHCGCGHSHN